MKKKKPNYKCSCFSSGYTKDNEKAAEKIYGTTAPWKWTRMFDKKKRTITVSIEKFYGNYHHWYSELKEKDNPFWLPPSKEYSEGCWVFDSIAIGQTFSERFNTEEGAKQYIDLILREHFPKHKVIQVVKGKNKYWNYSKDGD